MVAIAAGPEGVSIYDTATGLRRAHLDCHAVDGYPMAGASAVDFSPDGRTLGTGGFDRKVIVWELGEPDAATPSEGDASDE